MFAAIAYGLLYIIVVGFLFQRHGRIMTMAWRLFPFAQFLYIGPPLYLAKSRGRIKAFQGWLIGAAIAAVVYAPCWGLAWAMR